MEQVRKQATILYNQLVLTREWFADHETLVRVKDSGTLENFPSRKNCSLAPDGIFAEINPSILTSELSERASRSGLYYFKLTNTNYLNPKNAPDNFERYAIDLFRKSSAKEIFRVDFQNAKPVLRYIAPVYLTKNCLSCHSGNGIEAGDVGGCLSIFIPMDEARNAIQKSGVALFIGTFGFGAILIVLLFGSTRSLMLNRIQDIKSSINRIHLHKSLKSFTNGDELKEISDFCYLIDEKLKQEHQNLEKAIIEATQDLSRTKNNLEKANKDLEQLNIAKSEFFSDISHELRTPLTNIKGAVDILERTSSDNSKYIEIIRRNSEHLIKLVADFLDYSRLEMGHLELKLEKTPLEDLVQDAIIGVKVEAQKKCVTISTQVAGLLLKIDRDRIYQVLTNLLANAIRFSPIDGVIIVKAKALDDALALITIQDSGPGVDEKYVEDIFRKFFQAPLPKDYKIRKGSSGIGLAICRALVEAHNGKIWAENIVGAGCKFCFTAPRWRGDESKTSSDS